jgi:hypothetical protein
MEANTIQARSENSAIMQMLLQQNETMSRFSALLQSGNSQPEMQTWTNMMSDVLRHPDDKTAIEAYEKWFGHSVIHLGIDELLNPIFKHRLERLKSSNSTSVSANCTDTLGINDGGSGNRSQNWVSLRSINPEWLQSPAAGAFSAESFLTKRGLDLLTRFPGFGEFEC